MPLLRLQRQRLAARREHRDARTGLEDAGRRTGRSRARARSCRARAARCRLARCRRTACSGDSPSSSTAPTAPTSVIGTSSERCSAASGTNSGAVGVGALDRLAASTARRVLPTPPGPGERDQPGRPSRSAIARSSSSRPIVAFGGAGSLPAGLSRAGAASSGSWARILPWSVGELLAGLDPELSDEDAAGLAIGVERVRLAAAAIQGEHQLRVQPLPPRMRPRELPQLGDQLRVAACLEAGLHPQLDRLEALLLQPRDLGRGERAATRARRAVGRATGPAPPHLPPRGVSSTGRARPRAAPRRPRPAARPARRAAGARARPAGRSP